ncbi:hypothetical protein FB45DRAFT_888267 [Roridomyces roridus]|uniref:Uncharacterized protein n=1 Tax=Roridomyces roridus TaxID=1738132 RepID=A0AAD7CJN5_9AGAR|nr:hypothetical protein FB45DRAFT_888267 [Roridomyces roridus]
MDANQNLPLERSWYIGNTIFAILYGVELCMFFLSSYFLWKSKSDNSRKFYIIYGAILTILITIAMSCNLFFGQMMWIEHRDVDGGPVAYFGENVQAWYNVFGTAADITADILSNALMLYRCYVFWGSSSPWAVVFPGLLFLSSAVMGLISTVQSARADFFAAVNLVIPWLVLTLTFNVVTTCMIAFRLVSVGRGLRQILGKERAEVYTGVVAILIESALPFTLLGIGYVITYVRNDPEALAFASIWGCFVSLSPQAIILRVSLGAGWTKQTISQYGTDTPFEFSAASRSNGTALQTIADSRTGKESAGGSGSTSTFPVFSRKQDTTTSLVDIV